ncbi:MAG: hypothetical protein ABJG78_00905 [Cyclobacteriaceae bacterium]
MSEIDLQEINKLTSQFFGLFTNSDGKVPQVDRIRDIFIEEGMIINNTSGQPLTYNLDSFIEPRKVLLGSGTLIDFSESEISHETQISGNVAQRFSRYQKSGKLNGKYFETEGMKTIQFVKVDGQWKMSSVAWSDKP